MPNKTYALEWIIFAKKNLDTARLLFNVNHYEDIIGIELQQTLEKSLKALMANYNIKIPKEHDLIKLYFIVENKLTLLDEQLIMLRSATNYYKEDRYPNPYYCLPSREEISAVLDFTEEFFLKVCIILNIESREIKNEKL